ncbi:hypothetical protein V5O48_009796 [Marasmius crinis-equi]|uniref:GST N-terminal domain-containing protein n=1 Tax=Marasmius crinis-equi TaxID=585013 RepID=A0ABR3FAV2_9AGAR
MTPAFGPRESKALVPIFASAASSLTNKWKDLLSMSKDETEVFNIPAWTSRATLDAIGHAGFDYDFGALENKENRLSKAYYNLFADMFATPSNGMIITGALSSLLPLKVMSWLLNHSSNERVARGRNVKKVSAEIAQELVSEKSRMLMTGEGKKDVMSLLANSLAWTLLELSRHPEIQERLREEIRLKEQAIFAEGRTEFTAEDLDSLPYLNAVLKESLRYNPVAIYVEKVAMSDDCILLSETIKTISGKEISEIPVAKGQRVVISVSGYNRNPAVFGDDAHVFRPERWLHEESGSRKTTAVGVYANLLTFSGGIRSCIGWRFAVLELQTFLVELVGNFEFSLTPQCDKIRREACAVMIPTIEGEVAKGTQYTSISMEPSKPILFYDIASAPPVRPFAPNPWKTRYALNFKNVHYQTEWVELPDVTSVRQRLGAAPVRKFTDGSDFYTLPVIKEQSTGEIVGDSFDIAVYLDQTYPDSGLKLFPGVKEGLGLGLYRGFNTFVDELFTRYIILFGHGIPFNPETAEISKAEFCRRAGGKKWEELGIEGEARTKKVEEFRFALESLAKLYRSNETGPFLEGREPSYADLIVGGWLRMMENTLREWEEMRTWHDGLWGKLRQGLLRFAEVK